MIIFTIKEHMDATEKKVLQTVSKKLKDSATTDWRTGDVDIWADWAKRMGLKE